MIDASPFGEEAKVVSTKEKMTADLCVELSRIALDSKGEDEMRERERERERDVGMGAKICAVYTLPPVGKK